MDEQQRKQLLLAFATFFGIVALISILLLNRNTSVTRNIALIALQAVFLPRIVSNGGHFFNLLEHPALLQDTSFIPVLFSGVAELVYGCATVLSLALNFVLMVLLVMEHKAHRT